jgi:hypothetical protein
LQQVKITRFQYSNIPYWHIETGSIWIIIRLIVKIQSYQLIARIYIKILKWCGLFLSFIISWAIILNLFDVKYLYLLYIRRLCFCFHFLKLVFNWFIKNNVLPLGSVFLCELINLYVFLNVLVDFSLYLVFFYFFLVK